MGLFDGFEAGWNSFKNNELKAIGDAGRSAGEFLISPNPVIKFITNPQKAIEQPETLLPLGNSGPVEQWKEVAEDAKERALAPNPVISVVTGNAGDVFSNKSASDKWDNVVEPVKETVAPIAETVKETVQNVTKGVGSALPILAIGGGVILAASLLLGRN